MAAEGDMHDGPGAFAVDLEKVSGLVLGVPRPTLLGLARLWLASAELQCVAAYRFGRYAARVRDRRRLMGLVLVVVHRLWNRRITHRDHVDISRRADIGPGLLLMHRFGILVGPCVIGGNCVLHHNVTIGQRVGGGDQGVPAVGANVWIGPGATITGAISVGDGVTIAAGSVLSKDVPEGALVAGNPGRVIARDYDNRSMINFVLPSQRSRSVDPDQSSTSPEPLRP